MEAVSKAAAVRLKRLQQVPLVPPPSGQEEPQIELPPPLTAAEQHVLLERARERALAYTGELPSFICLQVTKRHVDPTGRGDWQMVDSYQARLSYDKAKGESYQLVTVNNQLAKETADFESLGGSTSTGEFGTLLRVLFEKETGARFEWARQAALNRRPMEVFNYSVDQERSTWHITFQKIQTVIPAYRGRVWVDRETGQVMRLLMVAVNIPKDFPIRIAETTLDYDFAAISGLRFLLPSRAAVVMGEGRLVTRNEIEFRLYRKFTTEATVTFDLPEEEKKEEPKKPPPKK
jgi:hypothetical protein